MKQQLFHSGYAGVGLLSLFLSVCAAQDAQPGAALAATPSTAEQTPGGNHAQSAVTATTIKHSAGVDDVLRLVQAGVSENIIKAYVENSAVAYNLNASDLIVLKKGSVPDDITTAMMKRGAMLRMQASQVKKAITPVLVGSNQLDPESYEYFQYYYLHPRALASANERLLSPYRGVYAPSPFHPVSPLGFQAP